MSTERGKLIVIDGGDGAGKKTQTGLLIGHLERDGQTVATLDFPQYEHNHFGQLIRECQDGKHGDFLAVDPKIAATLYAADRFESKEQLESWLAAGKVVVIDRYVTSSMLHQGGKIDDPKEREAFLTWLDHMEHELFGMPRPDLIIYCAITPKTRMQLLEAEAEATSIPSDMLEQNLDHQERTDQPAEQIAARLNNWHTIQCERDGTLRSPEDIHEEIYSAVKNVL